MFFYKSLLCHLYCKHPCNNTSERSQDVTNLNSVMFKSGTIVFIFVFSACFCICDMALLDLGKFFPNHLTRVCGTGFFPESQDQLAQDKTVRDFLLQL